MNLHEKHSFMNTRRNPAVVHRYKSIWRPKQVSKVKDEFHAKCSSHKKLKLIFTLSGIYLQWGHVGPKRALHNMSGTQTSDVLSGEAV